MVHVHKEIDYITPYLNHTMHEKVLKMTSGYITHPALRQIHKLNQSIMWLVVCL